MKKITFVSLLSCLLLFVFSCHQGTKEFVKNPNVTYRPLGATGLEVSEIGLGCAAFAELSQEQSYNFVSAAIENGVNYLDVYDADPKVRDNIGFALKGRRNQMIIQGHIGCFYNGEQYERTRDISNVKKGFEDLLQRLGTDYVEVGMLHLSDDLEDWNAIVDGPLMQYAQDLKKEGKIKHIGMSSHNAKVALAAAKSGLVEVIMFSMNPAFDALPSGLSVWEEESYNSMLSGIDPLRVELYDYCALHHIAVVAMKAFGGANGRLLDAERTPLKSALTPVQCLSYALSKPCVSTVVCGAMNADELMEDVRYEQAGEEERDYKAALSGTAQSGADGTCTYCHHCSPCPKGIDIAKVNELLDKAKAAKEIPTEVLEEYRSLNHKAGECVQCGACESRCPFAVSIRERMKEAKEVFGE